MFCLIVRKFYSFMDLDEVIMPSPIEFPPGNGLGWRGFFFLLFYSWSHRRVLLDHLPFPIDGKSSPARP